jgi:CelD/BcsL family acetyltransferase involved in cellulose biosynthesis
MSNSGNQLRLEVFDGVKGIEKIYDEWVELSRRCRASHLMQLPDYYLSYAKLLAPTPNSVLVAAFYDNSALSAILPLQFTRRTKLGIAYGLLEFPSTSMPVRSFVMSDHLSFQSLVTCLSKQFDSVYGEQWDMLKLVGIIKPPTDDVASGEPPKILTTAIAKNNYIQLVDGDYIQDRLSAKNRNNLRRRMKRLVKLGDFAFKTISSLPELNDAYDAFVETEAAGWKSRRGGKRAIKLHPDQRAFYHDLLVRHAKDARSHIHLLDLDGRTIASEFCLLAGNSAFSLKSGYDEAYSEVTPSH